MCPSGLLLQPAEHVVFQIVLQQEHGMAHHSSELREEHRPAAALALGSGSASRHPAAHPAAAKGDGQPITAPWLAPELACFSWRPASLAG